MCCPWMQKYHLLDINDRNKVQLSTLKKCSICHSLITFRLSSQSLAACQSVSVSVKICFIERDERITNFFFIFFSDLFFSYATFPIISFSFLLYRSSTRYCYAAVPIPNISIVFMSQKEPGMATYVRCS